MHYKTLTFDIRENVAWIILNRPESFNAMDLACMQEILHVANRCGSEPSVRAAVLTGAGTKAFCAGGDVAGFARDPATVDLLLKEMTTCLHTAISRFAWMNAPLIGAINGVAAGAGLSMAACCDLAIASDTARFTSAYTQIGLSPDGSSTYYLTRIIGTRRALEMFLTNRSLTALEALDWGLVNQVVPADQLMSEVTKLANKLAQGPTRAHGAVKKLVLMSTNESLESQMERETRSMVELCKTVDGVEGVQAFVAKRKPKFVGQ
jgi:2-(1,2-epoxy-1,2-dihydrophenyl)acetyl-CoA isomerase